MLDHFIRQLGQELDMEELITQPEPGRYIAPFSDDVQVDLTQRPQSYLFKGVIGSCPKDNLDAYLFKVMEANLFGLGTRGAAIGLNNEGNMLTLSLELDYNSTYQDFRDKLEDFVSVVDFWRKEALKHH